jgi:hypothetical protein
MIMAAKNGALLVGSDIPKGCRRMTGSVSRGSGSVLSSLLPSAAAAAPAQCEHLPFALLLWLI